MRLSTRNSSVRRSARYVALICCLLGALVAPRGRTALGQTLTASTRVETSGDMPGAPASDWPRVSRDPLVRYELPNGLRVVLDVEPTESRIVICITYPVGSRDDPEGNEGAAWLLQRMLESGAPDSRRRGAQSRLEKAGGWSRGVVGADATRWVNGGPSSALARAIELEAERLGSPLMPRSAFDELRRAAATQEEKSRDVEEIAEQRLRQLVFQGYSPYAHAVEGTAASLRRVDLEAVSLLKDRRIRVGTAVLSIVGNFSEPEARRLVQRYFGKIAGRGSGGEPAAELPRQTSERFNASVDARVKTPLAMYGWPIPSARSERRAALHLVAELLAGSDVTRLRAALSAGSGHALDVRAWTFPHVGPSGLAVRLALDPDSSVDEARAVLEKEIQRLVTAGPTDAELERAKAKVKALLLQDLAVPATRATLLAEHELWYGDAGLALAEPARYDALTRRDVRVAAAQHLVETRRTSVEIYPPGWPQDEPPAVVRRQHVVKAGESLSEIAKRHHTSVEAVAIANRITSHRFIFPGQELIIPAEAADVRRARGRTYTVKPGDSLSVIAERHGVRTTALAEANGRRNNQRIVVGETLTIPSVPPRQPTSTPEKTKLKEHRVTRGDTLIGVARRYRVSPENLARANGRNPKRPIVLGELLIIPASGNAAPTPKPKRP